VKAGEPNTTRTIPLIEARPAALLAPAPEQPCLAGRYFTNGAALYRVVGWLRRAAAPPLAELEDCATLRLALLTREDLATMALRPVALTPSVVE
jgi:hypothetical protein